MDSINRAAAKTRKQALRDLGIVIAEIWEAANHLSAREAAERAWHEGHLMTLDELTDQIEADRSSQPAVQRSSSSS